MDEVIKLMDKGAAAIIDFVLPIFLYGVLFSCLSVFLRNPHGQGTKSKNFAYVDATKPLLNKEFKVEISFYLFNALFMLVAGASILALMAEYSYKIVLPSDSFKTHLQALPLLIQIFCMLFLIDLSSYGVHRLLHRFLWHFHSVHHAAEQVSWMTSLRLHPVEKLFFAFLSGGFLYLFGGFSAEAFVWASLVDGIYNMFVHLNLQLEYPKPLRYIFVSPNNHRWHHAREEREAYDKNFATVFSLIDLALGTYYHPERQLPKSYGLRNASFPKTFLGQLLYPVRRQDSVGVRASSLR